MYVFSQNRLYEAIVFDRQHVSTISSAEQASSKNWDNTFSKYTSRLLNLLNLNENFKPKDLKYPKVSFKALRTAAIPVFVDV